MSSPIIWWLVRCPLFCFFYQQSKEVDILDSKSFELYEILKKPVSEEAEYEFINKIFPIGSCINLKKEDLKALYLTSKAAIDIGKLEVNWKDIAKKQEASLKTLLNSLNVNLEDI